MQSESCIWDRERVCHYVLPQEDKTMETERREKEATFLFPTVFYHITRYLCGGQHCVFIQAEDSVGHYGLVGQETAAHHLQRRKHKSAKGQKNPHTSLRSSPLAAFHLWSFGCLEQILKKGCTSEAEMWKKRKERMKPLFMAPRRKSWTLCPLLFSIKMHFFCILTVWRCLFTQMTASIECFHGYINSSVSFKITAGCKVFPLNMGFFLLGLTSGIFNNQIKVNASINLVSSAYSASGLGEKRLPQALYSYFWRRPRRPQARWDTVCNPCSISVSFRLNVPEKTSNKKKGGNAIR